VRRSMRITGSVSRNCASVVAAAAISLACRMAHAGRTLDELCLAAGLTCAYKPSLGEDVDIYAVVVHSGSRTLLRKMQNLIANVVVLAEIDSEDVTILPPLCSSHVVARIAAKTLQSDKGLHASSFPSTDVAMVSARKTIERARALCKRLDTSNLEEVLSLSAQMVAAVTIICASVWLNHPICLETLAKATISCTVKQILATYNQIVPTVNYLEKETQRAILEGSRSRSNSSPNVIHIHYPPLPVYLDSFIKGNLLTPNNSAVMRLQTSPLHHRLHQQIKSASQTQHTMSSSMKSSGSTRNVKVSPEVSAQSSGLFLSRRGTVGTKKHSSWQPQRSLSRNSSTGSLIGEGKESPQAPCTIHANKRQKMSDKE